ncbi:MAG: efflux transporter outer membrane subunit [Proteobacteria bacterium]|nr:efflux transporter outer membrane subunit [Pseudomonadota bacterium]
MNLRISLLTVAAGLALAGCVDRGGWRPTPQLQAQDLRSEQTLAGATAANAPAPADGWWRAYGDPQLDALVDAALAGSPSLALAQARLRAAQGRALAAGALRLPQASADAQVTRQRFPEHGLYPPPYAGSWQTDGRVALDLQYDLDFWGRNRALIAQSGAAVAAAQADQAAARLALAVAVVRAYVQLDLNYALLDVVNDQLKQSTAIRDLTRQRVDAGLENAARVKQSEGTLALTRAGVAFVEGNIELVRNQIADLVAAGPDRGRQLQRPQLRAPTQLGLPALLPSDLLARRPDIVAARAQVEAASQGIKAAEASFYPDVNLTAFAGLQSIGLSELFKTSARIFGATPALSLPVFNRRQLTGNLYAQQAQRDASVSLYNQTLLDAVREVADVVAHWQALERESSEQVLALEAAQSSYDLTTQRYRAGLDNYLSVLSSENQVLTAKGLAAQLQAQRLNFSIDLVRALGGGYTAPAG